MDHVTGFRCVTCGATLDIAAVFPWRCPNATDTDREHVLRIVSSLAPLRPTDDPNPFVSFGPYLAWYAFARAHGMAPDACDALVREVDAQVASVAGTGFLVTEFRRRAALSDELGFSEEGGVWVKDETGNVGGSHKARHLMSILLHLRAAESLRLAPWSSAADRPPLAIASCGNAAIAAATLAAATEWPITVFVPPWASSTVVDMLAGLGALVQECPRLDDDAAGDPCIHRFRETVAVGAIPFSVQGPENALCLDGGRTIGWEMTEALGHFMDRVFVQVGGGALASCLGSALRGAGIHPAVHAVQTAACAPLARAWERSGALVGGRASAATSWRECMWPWEPADDLAHAPRESDPAPPLGARSLAARSLAARSLADGILDDETYDWLGVLDAMSGSGGAPVVVGEDLIARAHVVAARTTRIDASATGTAGLAGLLEIRDRVADDERVAVIFSGVQR
jgi:threonine synthase